VLLHRNCAWTVDVLLQVPTQLPVTSLSHPCGRIRREELKGIALAAMFDWYGWTRVPRNCVGCEFYTINDPERGWRYWFPWCGWKWQPADVLYLCYVVLFGKRSPPKGFEAEWFLVKDFGCRMPSTLAHPKQSQQPQPWLQGRSVFIEALQWAW